MPPREDTVGGLRPLPQSEYSISVLEQIIGCQGRDFDRPASYFTYGHAESRVSRTFRSLGRLLLIFSLNACVAYTSFGPVYAFLSNGGALSQLCRRLGCVYVVTGTIQARGPSSGNPNFERRCKPSSGASAKNPSLPFGNRPSISWCSAGSPAFNSTPIPWPPCTHHSVHGVDGRRGVR